MSVANSSESVLFFHVVNLVFCLRMNDEQALLVERPKEEPRQHISGEKKETIPPNCSETK